MPYQFTPADRTAFLRCRRQWDFGARARQNLEPHAALAGPDFGLALREALDIYYFPGMWDWSREITLPLVLQGYERALARQRGRAAQSAQAEEAWPRAASAGRALLDGYFAWAPGVDRFSPVQVQPEFDVHVLDPDQAPQGLVTASGEAIRYVGRIDMLAVDSNDAYWIVVHRLADGDWTPVEALVEDAQAAAACWAWEQFYLGMAIAGTIYNEIRLPATARPPADSGTPANSGGSVTPDQAGTQGQPGAPGQSGARRQVRRGRGLRRWFPRRQPEQPPIQVRQHEPSGGGRSIPYHRRMYAVAREPDRFERIEQHQTAEFRRTWVRRTPAEVAKAGRDLAGHAAQMVKPDASVEPSPSPASCPECAYRAPCQAMFEGGNPAPLLQAGYRERPAVPLEEGRLGGRAWGMGRGAAPPRFPTAP
jgi:hypothetical protein